MKKILFILFIFAVFSGFIYADPLTDFFKETVSYIQKNGVSGGMVYDAQEGYLGTINLQLAQSKHNWLHFGVNAGLDNDISLGLYATVNGTKLLEKILGKELQYVKFFEVGYSGLIQLTGESEIYNGPFVIFLKKDF